MPINDKQSVAFLGSHPLGERCLEILTECEDISVELVVTYPPKNDNWWDGCLHKTAVDLGHTVVPLSEERSVLEYDIDYLLSVYYPNILDEEILEHPNKYSLNLHQAELPRYRGSNVFTHSILNARSDNHWKHGTTLHVMEKQVDSGDIVDRRFATISPTDTAWSLYTKVREKSVELFQESVQHIVDNNIDDISTPQSEFDGPRYFYPKSSLDGLKHVPFNELDQNNPEAYDRIRALDFPPHEPAYTIIQGEKIYLTLTGYQEI